MTHKTKITPANLNFVTTLVIKRN